MFDEYTDSDDDISSARSSSFCFARILEKDNKKKAIQEAVTEGDATKLKGLLLNSALCSAQCSAVEYFRGYFDTRSTSNSPHHPLLGDLREFAQTIKLAYGDGKGLNLVAAFIEECTKDFVDINPLDNLSSKHSANS